MQALISTISIDYSQYMVCIYAHLGTFIIACRGTYPPYCITYHRHARDIEYSTPDSLKGFARTAYPETQVSTLYLISIKATDRETRA